MRFLIKLVVFLAIVAGVTAAAYRPAKEYWAKRNRPEYRFVEVDRGTVRLTVNTNGEIKPKLSVPIGSFVSGPITTLLAGFNDEVQDGQILANVDPRIYQANVDRDEASLEIRKAEVIRVTALLKQANRDYDRAMKLYAEDDDFISDAELDRLRFSRESLEAELIIANASVKQAEATLSNSQANLDYTEIKAPFDGVVIDRKIDEGQTLAAQFQTPELFVLGVDMRNEMHIFASVDETDIGLIRRAKEESQPVRFRVEAYRDELFEGTIKEIRLSSTQLQNVVTYPVVVTAANPDLKLLPGMTAHLTFQIEERNDVIRIPWTALRYWPEVEHVREEDRQLITGREDQLETDTVSTMDIISAEEMVEASKKRLTRHVWIQDGDKLKAVEVVLGIDNHEFAEMVKGDLDVGARLVIGMKTK